MVGGGRRGKPSHDADFVVTHHNRCCLAGCCHDQAARCQAAWLGAAAGILLAGNCLQACPVASKRLICSVKGIELLVMVLSLTLPTCRSSPFSTKRWSANGSVIICRPVEGVLKPLVAHLQQAGQLARADEAFYRMNVSHSGSSMVHLAAHCDACWFAACI